VKSCLGDLPEIRLTDGTQKRDFVFILDVVSAYSRILACLGKMPTGYVELDVGRGVSVHVKDFARMICAAAGSSSELNFGVLRQREDEIMDSVADISPLRELGWEPRVGLEKGIAMTVQSFAGEDRND